jgi:hypothetical protein
LQTKKHINNREETDTVFHNSNISSLQDVNLEKECIYCKKIYASRQTLCAHLKICKEKNNKDTNDRLIKEIKNRFNDTTSQKELLTSLFTKKDILDSLNISSHELVQINNTTNNNNNNTINNTINNNTINQIDNRTVNNLNLFFNTKCKDAMNLSEFFEALQVTNNDVENMGRNGFSTGIYEIIDKGLKECGLYKRPIHCTDTKRETLYIKENDKWQKDDPDNPTVRKYVKDVRIKSINQSRKWKESHPNSEIIGSKEYEFWFYIMNNINNGGVNEIKNYNRIVSYISKTTDISDMRRQGLLI